MNGSINGYKKALGQRVKELRDRRRWSQAQLAAYINVDKSQISKIEHGLHAITLKKLVTLAVALGYQPVELLRFKYDLELNQDFSPISLKNERIPTRYLLEKLIKAGFFSKPRAVAEIVKQTKKVEDVNLKSAPTSGALLKFVEAKILKRFNRNGKFLYENK